eukprot:COSAG02_NODE_7979_length_2759_cov_1.745113_1_plen_25_part_10
MYARTCIEAIKMLTITTGTRSMKLA